MSTKSASACAYDSNELKRNGPVQVPRKVDIELIVTHLKRTERDLRAKDTSHLSAEQQERRERNLDRLHEYWQARNFPRNLDFPGERVPYFVDDRGVPCAMAYLIQESGHEDLVEQVAAENNHVYIEDIDDGPVLEWIKNSGLTASEAARIQPTYDSPSIPGIPKIPNYCFWSCWSPWEMIRLW